MELKGTRTEANLYAAFSGEAMARDKYDYFATKARQEGYEQLSGLFKETSNNEKAHAYIWYKLLHSGLANTQQNLEHAMNNENAEVKMYREFAQVAKDEGFTAIAQLFDGVADIEQAHETRFDKLTENIKSGRVFLKDEEATWYCTECGHIHKGKNAPERCPICAHPKSSFEVKATNY